VSARRYTCYDLHAGSFCFSNLNIFFFSSLEYTLVLSIMLVLVVLSDGSVDAAVVCVRIMVAGAVKTESHSTFHIARLYIYRALM
jgi:hypothetical protein